MTRADMPTPLPPAGEPLRVLLVEDHPVHQKLGTRLLAQQGWQVTLAVNGQQAVELTEGAAFDVILMDVEMPQMNGLTATRAIREREGATGRRTTIIGVTSLDDTRGCLAAGMDAALPKPLQVGRLIETLRQVTTADVLRRIA